MPIVPIFELPQLGAVRHRDSGVAARFDPPLALANEVLEAATVDVIVADEALFLWNADASLGAQIPYPVIALHAVARNGTRANPEPSLYLQLDLDDDAGSDGSPQSSGDDEPSPGTNVWLVPQNSDSVDDLFIALSECQRLHPSAPEPEDTVPESQTELAQSAQAALEHLERVFQMPSRDQFENVLQGRGVRGGAVDDPRFADAPGDSAGDAARGDDEAER